MLSVFEAKTEEEIALAKMLIEEYAASLAIDLSFQGFEQELALFPGEYVRPSGALILGRVDGSEAGVVALRKFSSEIGEMKRMYVRQAYRGAGLGRLLSMKLLEVAREIGYERVRLDTEEGMKEAIALYRSLGFSQITPHRHNPLPGAMYFELSLV